MTEGFRRNTLGLGMSGVEQEDPDIKEGVELSVAEDVSHLSSSPGPSMPPCNLRRDGLARSFDGFVSTSLPTDPAFIKYVGCSSSETCAGSPVPRLDEHLLEGAPQLLVMAMGVVGIFVGICFAAGVFIGVERPSPFATGFLGVALVAMWPNRRISGM